MRNFFNWGTDDAQQPAPPLAQDAPSPTGGAPTDAIAAARAKVEQDVTARRRSRSEKNTGSVGSDQQTIQAEIARQLEACYEPGAWGALLALPADAALAVTGRDNWKISKDERHTLGVSGSAAARTLMISNPRSLAFLMLASALFSVYVPRAVQEIKHQQEKRKNDREKDSKSST